MNPYVVVPMRMLALTEPENQLLEPNLDNVQRGSHRPAEPTREGSGQGIDQRPPQRPRLVHPRREGYPPKQESRVFTERTD